MKKVGGKTWLEPVGQGFLLLLQKKKNCHALTWDSTKDVNVMYGVMSLQKKGVNVMYVVFFFKFLGYD